MGLFRHAPTARPLWVAAAHFKAKAGFEGASSCFVRAFVYILSLNGRAAVREGQAAVLCAHLASVNADGTPVVVLGDFNDTPESLCAAVMTRSVARCRSFVCEASCWDVCNGGGWGGD